MTPPDRPDETVFEEPWQAQAFAMVIQLHRQGAFSWTEWAAALCAQRRAANDQAGVTADYAAWLAALETLAAAKGLTGPAELAERKAAWTEAYLATPHGQPVELPLRPGA